MIEFGYNSLVRMDLPFNLLRPIKVLWLLVFIRAAALADPLDQWTLRLLGNTNVSSNGYPLEYQIQALAYGNGMFIAGAGLGDIGMILASSDGRDWVPVLENSYTNFVEAQHSIAFGRGTFVTLGHGGGALASSNGVHWVRSQTPVGYGRNVAYGGGVFMAVGSRPAYSFVGTSWIAPSSFPLTFGGQLFDVAHGAGVWVAVGTTGPYYIDKGFIATSAPTPNQWISRHPGFTNGSVNRIAFGNGRFVASATLMSTTSSVPKFLISSNGVDWVVKPTSFGIGPGYWGDGLSFHNGIFFGVSGRSLYVSTNGEDWERRSLEVPGTESISFGRLGFGKNTFVVGGRGKAIIQSGPVVQLSQPQPATLEVTGIRGRTYAIQGADNLSGSSNQWQTLATMVLTNDPQVWPDPEKNRPARYYRAAWVP